MTMQTARRAVAYLGGKVCAELRRARQHVLEGLDEALEGLVGCFTEHRNQDSDVPLDQQLGLHALGILHQPH